MRKTAYRLGTAATCCARQSSWRRGVNRRPIWGDGPPPPATIPLYERLCEFRQTLLAGLLRLPPVLLRPVAFVSLLERPG